jgi:hypothetical protein
MIVADTGAIVALIDADDRHHARLVELFDDDPGAWVLPWAILPEVDYLLSRHVGARAAAAFVKDVADGSYSVEWGDEDDMSGTVALIERHAALELGLVDAVVMVVAERLRARAIATLDLRDFGAVPLRGAPKLYPRDL